MSRVNEKILIQNALGQEVEGECWNNGTWMNDIHEYIISMI
jgi:hypothetical protein